MRPGWILPLALVAMSAVFFSIMLAPLTDMVLKGLVIPPELRYLLSNLFWNSSLTAGISLCGAVAFLTVTRKENPSWYWGIPLLGALAFIAFSPLLSLFPIRDPTPAFYDPLVIAVLVSAYGTFLLPLCTILFFWSQRQLGTWRIVLIALALVITLNSLCFWYSFTHSYFVAHGLLSPPEPVYIDGHPVKTDGEGLLFLFLHYMVGMPITGFCFLTLAAFEWHAARRLAGTPLHSGEVLP